MSEGIKHDEDKLRYDLIPPEFYFTKFRLDADEKITEQYILHNMVRFWALYDKWESVARLERVIEAYVKRLGDQTEHELRLFAAECLAAVYTHGAKKYGDRNWERGMAWSRPYAAWHRHFAACVLGEDLDPDSGMPHPWHELWNVVCLYVYMMRGVGTDDRHI